VSGAEDFARLARRLQEAGETGLRRELREAVNDSVKPFEREVSAAEYLKPYLPDPYAEVLSADMRVSTRQRASTVAYGIAVVLQGRLHKREVQRLNRGTLRHPVFGRPDRTRKEWAWRTQTGGMRPGFFDVAAEAAKPGIRDDIQAAMQRVSGKITRG
jgi:hypothetical protein